MTLGVEFRLGDWTVQPTANRMVGPGGEARLEPKAMQVLSFLAGRAGEVLSKHEILTDVWEGTPVSEEVLPNAIWELRKALGDDAKRPRFIQTLPKRGYRLIAPVTRANGASPLESRAHAADPSPSSPEPPSPSSPPRWKWMPVAVALVAGVGIGGFFLPTPNGATPVRSGDPYSVVVMGFENHVAADGVQWLSTGVPTMLRTGLAELPGVHVMSEDEVGAAEDESTGEDLARRVGARALVRGSIFQQGPDYRIDVQVEDVDSARIVAAHSVRGKDVFQLTDELTAWVRDSLNLGNQRSDARIHPLRDMTTTSLDAFRLKNGGVEARRHLSLGDARRLLGEAVAIDPGFALAYFELQTVALRSEDAAAYRDFHEKTLAHQERLSPRKRALLEAMEVSKEDPERAEGMLEEVIERHPDEEEAYMQLYYLHRSRHRTGESLNTLERGGGQTREASRHYREFLALWAGADQGLPEWKEAESYLASTS